MRYITYAEWQAEGEALFGPDQLKWKFVCPVCGHIASVAEWKTAGAPLLAAGFSCIGRWLDMPKTPSSYKNVKGPCNYSGGGFFKLNPVSVTFPDTPDPQTIFEFYREETNTCSASQPEEKP